MRKAKAKLYRGDEEETRAREIKMDDGVTATSGYPGSIPENKIRCCKAKRKAVMLDRNQNWKTHFKRLQRISWCFL